MFKCAITGKTSKHGEAQNKIVVKKRARVYLQNVFNEEARVWEKLEVGVGWEIVKEVNASEEGVAIWNCLTEEQKANRKFK